MIKTELTGLLSLNHTEGLVKGPREADHMAHASS